MHARLWLPLMVCVLSSLHATAQVVVTGTSEVKGSKVRKSTLGSVVVKPAAEPFQGGVAVLEPLQGTELRLPCDLQVFPGDEPKTEQIIWRFSVPNFPALKSLRILRGNDVVAKLESPKNLQAPTLDVLESPSDAQLSLAWTLIRAKGHDESSYWVRWSKDDGKTWESPGQLFAADQSASSLDFDKSKGDPKGTLVEFWIPQGLTIHTFRFVLGKGMVP